MFYKHNFDERKHFITFSAMYGFSNYDTKQNAENYYYESGNLLSSYFNRYSNPLKINSMSVKADHTLNFSKFNISDGISFFSKEQNYDYFFENQINNEWILDNRESNSFVFNENYLRAYFSFGHQVFENFSYRLGAIAFYFMNYENSPTMASEYQNNYFAAVPNIYFNYTLKNTHSFDLTYDMALSRPGISELNPFRYYQNSEYFIEGNPYLTPQYFHKSSFTYVNLDVNISASVDYRYDNNFITLKPILDSGQTKIIGYQHDNFGNFQELKLLIPYKFSLLKNKLEFYLSVDCSYQETKAKDNSLNNHNWYYSGDVSIDYTFPTINLTVSLSEYYSSDMLSGYEKLKGCFSTCFSADYKIKKKWEFGVQLNDIFNQNTSNITYIYNNIEYKKENVPNSRFYRFRVTYYFGQK